MYPYCQKTFCENRMVKGKRKPQRQQVSQQKWSPGRITQGSYSKKENLGLLTPRPGTRAMAPVQAVGLFTHLPTFSTVSQKRPEVWRHCLVHSRLQDGDKRKHEMPPKLYMTFWWPQSDKKARILKEDLRLNKTLYSCLQLVTALSL